VSAGAVAVSEPQLRSRLAALTLEQKVRLLTGADFWSLYPEPAAGLRRVVVSDGPAGVRGEHWDEREPSANVPSPTVLAATWDEARIERVGRMLASECRRKGVDVLLAPTVNLHRSPYGGRHFECFSEDPLLTARIGVAYVRGLQGEGVGATVKHFVANDSETERFTLDAHVDERALRELYLAPFEAIVREAGAWAVMAAYNSVNGATMTEHPMLRDVLKDEWGFDGVVMSDWYAARTTEPAGRGGLDLVMPGPTGSWGDALVDAVHDGRVGEAAIDDKVLRILRLAGRVGALEGMAPSAPSARLWSDAEVAAELCATATAGLVLVKNGTPLAPLLPLEGSALGRVAVVGPNGAVARTLGGGSATVFPPYTVSPLEGLRAALGHEVAVEHAVGVRSHTRVAVADPSLLRVPGADAEGAEVRFLDSDGAVLASERRRTGAFTWMDHVADGVAIAAVAAVEVHTRLRAPAAGTYAVGCSGLGAFRLEVAGEPRLDVRLELPPHADPVEGMMRPPQASTEVVLDRGEEVDVVLHHELPTAGTGTSFEPAAVTFALNVEPPHASAEAELERAVALAGEADAAVVVVGTTEEDESEGFDRESLTLPGRQDELVRAVAAVNPRTVVVVNAGAPVLLPWVGEVGAVLLAGFPGQEFGNALADVLLGVAEPGGRLPTTWPAAEGAPLPSTRPVAGVLAYEESIAVGYRRPDGAGAAPAFCFGHGLGYTTWEYAGLELEQQAADAALGVRVRVRNIGARPGREVVQAYLAREDGTVPRPARWLAGFAIVEAGAGEEAVVTVRVGARAFAHWDTERRAWATEPGEYRLEVGRSSCDLRLVATVTPPG
jgi:beta-glucosidase